MGGKTIITIPGPVGSIEAVLSPPTQNEVDAVAIVCHPHPLYGGTMNNKVVTTLVKTFNALGLYALRFNFRGIGKSEGSYAEGIGEQEDALAVIHWAEQEFPGKKIWLAGFSFGAYVATQIAERYPVALLVTIAPPVHHFDLKNIQAIKIPWIIVQGDQDEVVPPEEVYAWIKQLSPPPKLIRIQDAGHFFHGRLIDLRELLENALREYL
jgi:uncharacterized protein